MNVGSNCNTIIKDMINKIKYFLTIVTMLIAIAGCRVSAINSQWLNYNSIPSDFAPKPISDKNSFIILKTGQNIPVNEIKYSTEQKGKRPFVLTADGKQYSTENVASFQVDKNNYFVGFDNKFYRRLIEGKISVYGLDISKTSEGRNGIMQSNWATYYYYTKVDNNLKELFNIKDVSSVVSDCPLAKSMVEGPYMNVYSKLKKSNNQLIYNAFSIYNNGCK